MTLEFFKAAIDRIFERENQGNFAAFRGRSFAALILRKRIFVEMQIFLKRVHPALNTVIIRIPLRVPTFFMAMLRHEVIILRGQFRMAFGIERAPGLQLLETCLPLILHALFMRFPNGLSKLFNREDTALGFLGLMQNRGQPNATFRDGLSQLRLPPRESLYELNVRYKSGRIRGLFGRCPHEPLCVDNAPEPQRSTPCRSFSRRRVRWRTTG